MRAIQKSGLISSVRLQQKEEATRHAAVEMIRRSDPAADAIDTNYVFLIFVTHPFPPDWSDCCWRRCQLEPIRKVARIIRDFWYGVVH